MFARTCTARSTALVAALLAAPLVVAAPAAAAAEPRDIADSCPAARVQPAHFADVLEDNVHALAIDCMSWWGVAAGRNATAYLPGESVERGQMATFLRRLIERSGGTLAAPSRDFFPDDDGVHEESINLLAEAGIVSGRANGDFEPGGIVQRGQMTTFLVNAYEARTGATLPAPSEDAFADDEADFHEANIDRAAEAGFVAGLADGGYRPSRPVLRDGMASFLARVLDRLVEEEEATPPPVTSGDFDLTFGRRGTAEFSFGDGTYGEAHDVAEAPDGTVVAAGYASRRIGVVRLTAAGAPDPTFGDRGFVTTPVGAGGFATSLSVAVQPDGKVVVAGWANPTQGEVDADFVLLRYTATGALDPTFSGDGIVTSSYRGPAYATELLVQPDGRILVGGSALEDRAGVDEDVAVERYTSAGVLDTTFGSSGRAVIDVTGAADYLDGMALQPDGRIVLAGSGGGNEDSDATVVRLLPTGALDTSFGTGGVATARPGPFARFTSVALQSDGSIVAAGSQTNGDRTVRQVVLVRFTADGDRDAGFGDEGVVVAQPAPQAEATDVTVDAADRVLVVGSGVQDSNRGGQSWVVLRLLPDGQLDETFSGDGMIRTAVGASANAVALDRDGRLLVAGCDCPFEEFQDSGGPPSTSSLLVARFRTED